MNGIECISVVAELYLYYLQLYYRTGCTSMILDIGNQSA